MKPSGKKMIGQSDQLFNTKLQIYTFMKASILILALLVSVVPVLANGPGLPGGDPDVPIDTGIYFLMALGLIYGLRTIRRNNQ